MNAADKVQIAHDIRRTIRELKDRGLLVSAKWASELLASLPKEARKAPHIPFSPPPPPAPTTFSPSHARPSIGEFLPSPGPGAFADSSSFDIPEAGPSRLRSRHGIEIEEEEDMMEEDEFQLARTYFDLREFDRVVWVLREARGSRARFLRVYSAYLSADRKAQESLPHFLDTKEERLALYPALNPLIMELMDDTDPYLIYLRGLLYMRIDQRSAAIECFIQSVTEKPYNWSAWSQLGQLIRSPDMFVDIKDRLPPSVMLEFCAITIMLDLHTGTDLVTSMISELLAVFPGSVHLKAQKALVFYHMRQFEIAEEHFDAVQKLDPYRMEEVDIFSNMLYVMDKRAKLGKLAHEYAEIDRNRAEVCCLVEGIPADHTGNYYSSRGDHTKAILYFKRALLLNRDYLPAWTLMGHEFVELKNSHAAIEAYRKAIDVNAKDYRAWYGLGQAYELLDMPMYAIEYYNQATSLRPYDCRMWTALATVYESLHRLPEAIECHTRALLGADRTQTTSILHKLASLHTSIAEAQSSNSNGSALSAEATGYHRKIIALGESEGLGVAELAGSYLGVAEWEMGSGIAVGGAGGDSQRDNSAPAGGGDWALASQYLEKVASTNAPQRDKAEAMLRELRLREARLAAGG